MHKALKFGIGIAGFFLAFFIAAAILLVVVVDPNDYKDEITQAVKEQTGRDLIFEGDIGFKFFPWLGLKVGPLALTNPTGFTTKEMVRIHSAEAKIQVLPLLSGNVSIGHILLDGLTANLVVNKHGISNWADLSTPSETPTKDEQPATHAQETLNDFSVAGVTISNANIIYDDQKNNSKTSISNVHLTIGAIGDSIATPFDLSFDLMHDAIQATVHPHLTGIAQFDKEAQTFQISELLFTLFNLSISGDFSAKLTQTTPFSGQLTLKDMSLREFMKELALDVPETTDPTTLTKLNAQLQLSGNNKSIAIDKLRITADATTIEGTASVHHFARPALAANFHIDTIDIDRYMPPTKKEAKQTPTRDNSTVPAQEPDLSALKSLDVKAKLTIGALKAMNLNIRDILCNLTAKNGIVRVKPLSANLYDGKLTATSVLNVNTTPAQWIEDAHLENVQAGPFLKDLTGKDSILGSTSAQYALKGAGLTPASIKQTITGSASFLFADGALNGVNIAKMIRDAFNLLDGKALAKNEPVKTDFTELLGHVAIQKGHATNDDLLMKSPLLRLTGKGWADLPDNTMDYLATVTVVGTLSGQDGKSIDELTGIPIPISIKGQLDNPNFGLDPKALAQALLRGKLKSNSKQIEDSIKKKVLGKQPGGISPTKMFKKLF